MFELIKGIRSILEASMAVRPQEEVLVVADNDGKSMWIGTILMNVANSMGANAVLTVKTPEWSYGHEPPAAVAAAMKSVNVVICISDKATVGHTNARKEATAAGVRYYGINQIPVDDLQQGVSAESLQIIKARTEEMAKRLTRANRARVTSPSGTDITVGLTGRQGLALNPIAGVVSSLPYYAEAAIAPVEGTAEGVIVADLAISVWNNLLRQPVRLIVKAGKVVDISGPDEYVDRLRQIAATDENASNIAELGIGASHIIPPDMHGTRRDYARIGTAHLALGKNSDIGGQTYSHIHVDALFSQATVKLDNDYILKDGVLLV